MRSLFEAYRPTCFEQVIGQDKAIAALKRLQDRGGFGGHAYFLAAGSGQGKTTIARLIAKAMDAELVEIDAQDCTMEFLRNMEEDIRILGAPSLFRDAGLTKCWVINEAHNMRGPILSRFLTAIEPNGKPLPDNVAIIFTTTKTGAESLFAEMADASPLLSRCFEVPMTSRGLADAFAERAAMIADKENLNGRDLKWYKRLMMDKRNNLRAALCAIEAGEALGGE